MLLLIPIIALVTSAHNGTRNFDVCSQENFKHPACWEAKQLEKAGKYLCKIQGKEYMGKAPGNNNGCSK